MSPAGGVRNLRRSRRQTCTMQFVQTSLPDLPFTNHGNVEFDPSGSGTHTTARLTPRRYPSTNLRTLTLWTSFPNDICRAVQSATTAHPHLSSTPFDIGLADTDLVVENEESLRSYATWALHKPVQKVLEKLGVNGRFRASGGGNVPILGNPDFLWVMSNAQPAHPKLIVRVPLSTCLLVVKYTPRVG